MSTRVLLVVVAGLGAMGFVGLAGAVHPGSCAEGVSPVPATSAAYGVCLLDQSDDGSTSSNIPASAAYAQDAPVPARGSAGASQERFDYGGYAGSGTSAYQSLDTPAGNVHATASQVAYDVDGFSFRDTNVEVGAGPAYAGAGQASDSFGGCQIYAYGGGIGTTSTACGPVPEVPSIPDFPPPL